MHTGAIFKQHFSYCKQQKFSMCMRSCTDLDYDLDDDNDGVRLHVHETEAGESWQCPHH